MLESMVPFYQSFIPVCCEGDPAKLKAAMEALAARNTMLVENIINPNDGESRIDMMRRITARARRERGLPPLDF
jgi:hypothetical protein